MKGLVLPAVLLLCLQSTWALSADDALMTRIDSRMHAAGLYIPDLRVDMENGLATVYGTVSSDIQRDEVIEVVSMTYGVKGTVNLLEIK